MKLWTYLKEKMRPYADRTAFAQSGVTYGDVLSWEQTESGGRLQLCEGNTRAALAEAILRCIAAGNVAVPVTEEYGNNNSSYIRNVVADAKDETADDLAFVIFTSGTTGKPKGVMLTHENITVNLEYIHSYFRIEGLRTICIGRPPVHIAVLVGELLYALCCGLTIHFYEEPFMPQRLLSFLVRHEIDVFCATPTLYQALAAADPHRKCPVKVGVISGEILTEKASGKIAAAFPDTAFYHVYGLTEHSPRVTALPPEAFARRPGSIGKPIGCVRLKIEDGELLIRSPCVMKGYYHDPARTAEILRGGWLHTGDRAHVDADGYLYIDGRADNMLIRAGLNIYPEEIEEAVKEIDGVDDCIVCGERTENGTSVILRYTGIADGADVRKRLAAVLNPHAMPDRIEKTEGIPRTASGKKQRT